MAKIAKAGTKSLKRKHHIKLLDIDNKRQEGDCWDERDGLALTKMKGESHYAVTHTPSGRWIVGAIPYLWQAKVIFTCMHDLPVDWTADEEKLRSRKDGAKLQKQLDELRSGLIDFAGPRET